jgi:hypothetical protein
MAATITPTLVPTISTSQSTAPTKKNYPPDYYATKVIDGLKEVSNTRDWFKVLPAIKGWMDYAGFDPGKGFNVTADFLKKTNNILQIPGFMSHTLKTGYCLRDLFTKKSDSKAETTWDVVELGTHGCESVSKSLDVVKGLTAIGAIEIPKATMSALGTTGDVANLTMSSLYIAQDIRGITKSVENLNDKKVPLTKSEKTNEKVRISHYSMDLVRSIGYVALACIGLIAIFSTIFMPPWISLSLVTMTVALGIAVPLHDKFTHYSKHQYLPKHGGQPQAAPAA